MADDTKSDTPDSKDKSSTETVDKGSKLAAALKEYQDSESKKAASKKDDDELEKLRSEVQALREAEASRVYRREMDENLVPAIKGDLDVHPKHVERWLNEQAASDPRLLKLWNEREDNPEAFQAAIEKLKPKFEADAKDEGLIGTTKARKDDAKLKSAVRSARTPSEPTDLKGKDLGGMTDNEFALHKAEVFRQQAAGQLT